MPPLLLPPLLLPPLLLPPLLLPPLLLPPLSLPPLLLLAVSATAESLPPSPLLLLEVEQAKARRAANDPEIAIVPYKMVVFMGDVIRLRGGRVGP
jgi:hypothetical protein